MGNKILGYIVENSTFTREEILRARDMKVESINNRLYEGQDLGIEYPDGSVVTLDEQYSRKFLKLDNEGFYRILDCTPLGRLPIVVIND